jgi:hypothetical protein
MISWVTVLAWIQTCREGVAAWLTSFRRDVLYPFAAGAGRDMLLLRNEQWVDANVCVPAEEVCYRYCADKHTIVSVPPVEGARSKRWAWLSVAYGGVDISDFFQGLRVPLISSVGTNAILMLFAHQRGLLPVGELTIVTRDGTEETVHAFRRRAASATATVSATEADTSNAAAVNYIR